jgi:hypothetical protein
MIALQIVGYWLGLGAVIASLMWLALQFARFCEYLVDRLK